MNPAPFLRDPFLRPEVIDEAGVSWAVAYCRLETVSLALACPLPPSAGPTLVLIKHAKEWPPSVAQSLVHLTLTRLGYGFESLHWYDADFLGPVPQAPPVALVHQTHPTRVDCNPEFSKEFEMFLSDSLLLPDRRKDEA